jgi:predicted GIY-YIG superfamily endonuclease
MLHFVYELVDPRTNDVAYVGITDNPNRRFQAHLSDTETNDEKRMWIEQLRSENLEPRMRILETVETREEAFQREKYWIRHYIEQGKFLINISLHRMGAAPQAYFSGPEYYSEEEAEADLNIPRYQPIVSLNDRPDLDW